ncbi:OsmC family protein [Rurimicrobium arvi]|uniref:OsmC family protein n=1 Tax=Rurimicrobium arvi TaxID=2049916 RepID=A0ABP8MW46_9BACT
MVRLELHRADNAFAFEAKDAEGHTMRMDAAATIGGNNSGVRPMQAMLMSMGGCSGIDLVSILQKQRQEIGDIEMIIEAEREKDKEPALWTYVHITFRFGGNVDMDKAHKACALSIDKYCSVAATLRAAGCVIEWKAEHKG